MLCRALDGAFAVPAVKCRAGWPGNCGPWLVLRACMGTGLDESGLQLVVKLANGQRNWTRPEIVLQKQP